jgi:hypothetical protein
MKWISSLALAVLTLVLTLCAQAADTVNLAWDASSTTNIAGYRIYYGTATNPATSFVFFTNVAPATLTVSLPNIQPGIAYFQATAYLANGLESVPSNVASYTNRNFGPVNLRITGSTNNTAAIWVDNAAVNMQVQWSSDLTNWHGWANLQSLDPTAPIGSAIYLAGIAPDPARYFRAITLSSLTATVLPAGQRLAPNTPPIPLR